MSDHLIRVGNVWHYRRRVPSYCVEVIGKPVVQVSTRRQDRAEALIVARRINSETERHWRAIAGATKHVNSKHDLAYQRAVFRARQMGFEYRTVDELANGDIEGLLQRVEALETSARKRQEQFQYDTEALLGGVAQPSVILSQLPERYCDLARDQIRGKSPKQIRMWRLPHDRAVANLIGVIGDKPICDITRDDALTFREFWIERIEQEGKKPATANKDIGHINKMLNEVSDKLRLGLERPFAGLRLKEIDDKENVSFAAEFIRGELLRPAALSNLNEQARLAVFAMIETGMRPSEIVNLSPENIRLDADIPHVCVRPVGRVLKTANSRRDIPLVGISLKALSRAKERFGGFPRYRDNSNGLSAIVNKYLENARLRPTPDHTLYSLRHAFQDRLIAAEIPERIQAELMGHKFFRERYGEGASLVQKRKWLQKICVSEAAGLD